MIKFISTLLLFSTLTYGKCNLFNLQEEIQDIQYIIQGEVIESNYPSEKCTLIDNTYLHKFKIKITNIYKGIIEADTIEITYKATSQKPEIKLFKVGEKEIFFLNKNDSFPQFDLFGKTCKRSHTHIQDSTYIKTLIDKSLKEIDN